MNSRYYLGVALAILSILVVFTTLEAKPTIAVMDFMGKGISDTEASVLTDRLRTELSETGKYTVVEREMMNVILAEQGFQMTGCTDQKCIVAAGQILNAAQVVAGSIGKVGNVYTVSARMVDVETGRIVSTATYDHEGNIGELLKLGMRNVAKALSGEISEEPRITDERLVEKVGDEARVQPSRISEPAKSALIISPSVFGNSDHGIALITIGYSRRIKSSVFFSSELGIGRWSERKGYVESSTQTDVSLEAVGISFAAISRLNIHLLNAGPMDIYAFGGLGGLFTVFEHHATAGDPPDINVDKTQGKYLLLIPVGASVRAFQRRHTLLYIDLGCMFSPSEVLAIEKEWGSYAAYHHHNPSMSPSGVIVSLRFWWHI